MHLEPESREERAALSLLLDSVKIDRLSDGADASATCPSVFREHLPELIVGDLESAPSASRRVVK